MDLVLYTLKITNSNSNLTKSKVLEALRLLNFIEKADETLINMERKRLLFMIVTCIYFYLKIN